ncbi:MAG: hypothetical protein ACYTGZ_22185 [Planctomycetota bacterium]
MSKSITGTVTMLIFSGQESKFADGKSVLKGVARKDFEATTSEAFGLVADGRQMVKSIEELIDKTGTQVDALAIAALREELDDLLARMDKFIERTDKLVADFEGPAVETAKGARDAVKEYQELGENLRRDWDEKLSPKATRLLDETGNLVESARPKVDSLLQKLNDAGSLATTALVKIQDLTAELKGTVVESRPHLVATLRHARSAIENFEATTSDLKSSPWKLVNKPSAKEAKTQIFLEAASLYLKAAREVNASVDDLNTLQRLGALTDEDSAETVDRATKRLAEASKTMKEQEPIILKHLKQGK